MENEPMSFIRPTSSASPFTTSTAFNTKGPTAFNQSWMTVTGTNPPVASLSGSAIANTAWSSTGGSGRVYYENHDHYELAAHTYYTSYQVFVASIDECMAAGDEFKLLIYTAYTTPADTSVSRTNIIRTGF